MKLRMNTRIGSVQKKASENNHLGIMVCKFGKGVDPEAGKYISKLINRISVTVVMTTGVFVFKS